MCLHSHDDVVGMKIFKQCHMVNLKYKLYSTLQGAKEQTLRKEKIRKINKNNFETGLATRQESKLNFLTLD